ncbi:MAG TPA: FAD-binding oxidoreductase [Acidimicrobiales bacterium]|nr:FAD-binding oxidoreductase [Acidimicrobiales bacterium]
MAARLLEAVTAGSGGHGPHSLRVKAVVRETPDAVSLVLDVPPRVRQPFSCRAGQFVTLRVGLGEQTYLRSYSMSSSPELDRDPQITVKGVDGGVVSNWINDHVGEGARLDVDTPSGSFVLDGSDREIISLAAGSGASFMDTVDATLMWNGVRR